MAKYVIGVDFGTLSARAIMVDVCTGEERASCEYRYPRGIFDETLPGSTVRLKPLSALQDPSDYSEGLVWLLREVLQISGVEPQAVVGIGLDATASTMLPVNERYVPLCHDETFRGNPHSWIKMWKHHSAHEQASHMLDVAVQRKERFLQNCGGRISAEWMFPKIYETLCLAPDVYKSAYRFMEVADWLVFLLTGRETHNSCMAGFKAMWSPRNGYPSSEYFRAVDERLSDIVEQKMSPVAKVGEKAGGLTLVMSEKTGLLPGTAVGVANTDGHHILAALGITGSSQLAIILGTSIIHMLANEKEIMVSGVGSIVEDGLLPGYFGYETGQPAAGDMLAWFVENMLPSTCHKLANQAGLSVFQWLEKEATKLSPGSNGILALDWWNGNRSVLADMELSGLIVGLTLQTRSEQIYRALLESMAFGTKLIIENYRTHGIKIDRLVACGGIAYKSQLTMQIFADVIGLPIAISKSTQTPALGAAMYGACAAGKSAGGVDTIFEASSQMARLQPDIYMPDNGNHTLYCTLYKKYEWLYDCFGKKNKNLMAELKGLSSRESVCEYE